MAEQQIKDLSGDKISEVPAHQQAPPTKPDHGNSGTHTAHNGTHRAVLGHTNCRTWAGVGQAGLGVAGRRRLGQPVGGVAMAAPARKMIGTIEGGAYACCRRQYQYQPSAE